MTSVIVQKILERIHQPELFRTLAEDLTGTELNSLLLEVFNHRVGSMSAPDLLQHYRLNRFVKPADLPMLELKQTELDLLKIFQRFSFEPIELSPVSVLGSCSVVASADQKKVLSALRGTEVLADATNAIALHCCDLKTRPEWESQPSGGSLRFGTVQRHVRTQQIQGKGFTPHFKIGCLVTSGRDTGSYSFEKESLLEHLEVMKFLYTDYYSADSVSFRLLCRPGYADTERLAESVQEYVLQQHPEFSVDVVREPEKETGYYKGIQYKIDIKVNGKSYEIGDGGFVDWPQQYLQNKKERMLTTGFGFEFMYRILKGEV
jgi:hypothetical protein